MKRVASLAAVVGLILVVTGFRPPSIDSRPELHTELKESTPARDTTLATPLETVVLVFSEPVEPKLSSIRWFGPAGDTLSLEVSAPDDQPEVLIASAPPAADGPQRLEWRTVSVDGHQVSGTIPFTVRLSAPAGREAGAGPDSVAGSGESAPGAREEPETRPVAPSTARLAVGGIGMLCLLGFAGLLWFGMGTTILDEPRTHRLTSVLGLGATVLLALDAVLWLAQVRVPGTDLAGTLSAVLDTRSGAVVAAQVALAALAFLVFTGTHAVRFGAFVGMLAVVVGALGGHQASIDPLISLPANGLHLGAAAVWTGGILLLGIWPSRIEPGQPGPDVGWTFPRIALRVSSAALLASTTILVTGVVQDVLYLPSIGALFSSTYGYLLLAKTGGFLALVGFGAYNKFRLIPALVAETHGEAGPTPLRRSVRLELIVVVVVVLVAVALAQVPPPVG
ncbi:MAG: copper resistance protein CopC [Gemmatimonadales bacterium]|jgi:copper transport protein